MRIIYSGACPGTPHKSGARECSEMPQRRKPGDELGFSQRDDLQSYQLRVNRSYQRSTQVRRRQTSSLRCPPRCEIFQRPFLGRMAATAAKIIVIRPRWLYIPRIVARQREESPMKFNPEEWRKLSERQRRAVIKKIEREEKRAKTVMVVMVCILVFAFLLFLLAIMSSCPTPQDATPTGRGNETQAQRKPSRAREPGSVFAAVMCRTTGDRRADSHTMPCNARPVG
jgi:hypothetical protein